MAFKLDAGVLSQTPGKKTGQSWPVYDVKSLGVWPGDELTDSCDCGEGTLTAITTKFAMMTKAKPNEKKPMTFSWSPTSREDKSLFKSILRHRSFQMKVGIKNGNGNFWLLTFQDVKLMNSPIRRKNIEQIQTTFLDFYLEPGLYNQ